MLFLLYDSIIESNRNAVKFILRHEKRLPADDSLFPQREGISYWDCVLPQCENIGEFSQLLL